MIKVHHLSYNPHTYGAHYSHEYLNFEILYLFKFEILIAKLGTLQNVKILAPFKLFVWKVLAKALPIGSKLLTRNMTSRIMVDVMLLLNLPTSICL